MSPNEASPEELVTLLVGYHQAGSFVRDPSPLVLRRDDKDGLFIRQADLEKRSKGDVPELALSQLWSLMRGYSPRQKLAAGANYLKFRGMTAPLERILKSHREAAVERCIDENRDFKVIQTGELVWHARRDLLTDTHQAVLNDPDAFLIPSAKTLKMSRGTTLATTPGSTVLKRFNLKKVKNLLRNQFLASKAHLAFQRAYHLESIGIRTARAIAFAERYKLGVLTRSYLLMEQVTEVRSGAAAFQEWNGHRNDLKGLVLEDAGRLLGLLHDAGFANRDLKASNMLVNESGQVWLIDLDGVSQRDRISEEVRLKNLRRIVKDLPQYGELSIKEAMHFLKSYTRSYRQGDARHLYRRLAEEPWA
ncbi:MAG: lipopolysaccharide kinase InaA family protein [Planctomycetota bacterium]